MSIKPRTDFGKGVSVSLMLSQYNIQYSLLVIVLTDYKNWLLLVDVVYNACSRELHCNIA